MLTRRALLARALALLAAAPLVRSAPVEAAAPTDAERAQAILDDLYRDPRSHPEIMARASELMGRDDTVRLQAAVARGGVINLEPREYLISGPLIVGPNTTLNGHGATLVASPPATYTLGMPVGAEGIEIKDLSIDTRRLEAKRLGYDDPAWEQILL